MTSPASESVPALEARGIVKAFPGIVANDEVDFDLRSGEIHALLGENGAGKSTLMNILAGLYRPDAGQILLDGTPIEFRSPRDAITAGLGMVHQHFTLVPSQTVTENILLGLDQPRFRMNLRKSDAEVARLADQFGLRVDPRAKIWQLSVGEQQRVEILKLLYRGARILIMDEPTAVLAPQEVDELFRTLRSMTADGRSVVFISHKLGEVLAIADRITVMRRGKVTAAGLPPSETSTTDLARRMVGRDVLEIVERTPQKAGARVLAVRDVTADNDRGLPALRGVSLDVAAGEIVGIAAVAGNGQSELAQVITGLRPCGGSVTVNGEEVANRMAGHAIRHGVAHVPEDRTGVGSSPNLSVADNLIMKRYRDPPVARGWFIDDTAARALAQGLKDEYAIAAPSIDTEARLLSGGNLQRLIFAREIETGPRLMVAVQPTRGLDVGAIESVHRVLLARREAGTAILLISEELDELLSLADRIDVLYEGRIVGSFSAADADIHDIGLLMTGGGAAAGVPVAARGRRVGHQPMNFSLEPRTDAPRWLSTVADVRRVRLRPAAQCGDHRPRRRRPDPLLRAHRRCRVRERRGDLGHPGQGDTADPDRSGLLARVPDAALEHRRGGSVPARRLGRQRDRPRADPAGRDTGDRRHPGDDGGRRAGRRAVGLHPGDPAGAARGQRDHRDPDAQLHRPAVGPVLGLRAVERGWLPADRGLPARGLVAAPDRSSPRSFRGSAA